MNLDPLARIVAHPGRSTSSSTNGPTRATLIDFYDPTELGNARRLVDRYGRDLRYAEGRGWLAWDERRWRPGAKGSVIRKVKEIARQMKREATILGEANAAEKLFRWALRSQSRYVIDATVALAWSEPEIETSLDDLDADPWLLNVLNGTLDLRTGQLRRTGAKTSSPSSHQSSTTLRRTRTSGTAFSRTRPAATAISASISSELPAIR